jgi:glyoxylase-like metal-dependent hydrolase (beta-lactamase superfamily II)
MSHDAPESRPGSRGGRARLPVARWGRVGRIPTPTPLGVGDINCYLLFPPEGARGLTLIDTGVKTPESFEALRTGMKALGVAFEDLAQILVTHAHMDHFGQARLLRELSGARVLASRGEAERMRFHFSPAADRRAFVVREFERWGVPAALVEGQSRLGELARSIQDPIEVDATVDDGDVLAIQDLRLSVIATPGHCEAHVVFYEPELRVLFSGDHLLTDISPVPLLVFPEREGLPRPKSLVRFLHSLARVEPLDCDAVYPAHGDVIRDHRKLIAGYRLHHERRKLQILRRLAGGPATPWELARRLFPAVYEAQVYLVMSEVIGHLEVLAEDGSIAFEERDGVTRVRAV